MLPAGDLPAAAVPLPGLAVRAVRAALPALHGRLAERDGPAEGVGHAGPEAHPIGGRLPGGAHAKRLQVTYLYLYIISVTSEGTFGLINVNV